MILLSDEVLERLWPVLECDGLPADETERRTLYGILDDLLMSALVKHEAQDRGEQT